MKTYFFVACRFLVLNLALSSVLLCLPSPAEAAGYLEFEGIPGEATDKFHEGWIEIDSVQFDVKRPISLSGGGRIAERPTISDLVFTKQMDRSSPLLFMEAVAGGPSQVEIHFTTPTSSGGERLYLKIVLHDAFVSSISTEGSDTFAETIGLSFGRIDIEYLPEQGAPVTASYTIQGTDV